MTTQQILDNAPKDGTYIEVTLQTEPFAVIRNVYWCGEAENWAEGGRVFSPELPSTATWRLMDSPVDQPWQTNFVREHKRSPTARRDGVAVWLRNEIEYLESITRTDFGDGSLSSYKAVLREIER